MLNAIRFVVPIGGGWAFEALIACRNVQPAPQVDPSVSAVDPTVNVMATVGIAVPVSTPLALPLILAPAPGDCGVKLDASKSADVDIRVTARVRWSAEARMDILIFFFIILLS
jgi:hypothetical protein